MQLIQMVHAVFLFMHWCHGQFLSLGGLV
uniref:Uncharacterized protein n=1 Tax=Arundo donax TaxID=35708 RepID=A0A0A9GGY8_ARUDO